MSHHTGAWGVLYGFPQSELGLIEPICPQSNITTTSHHSLENPSLITREIGVYDQREKNKLGFQKDFKQFIEI
jgi:hypothetical protein